MKYPCTVTRLSPDLWRARHESSEIGRVEALGTTRDEALEKLRDELRYCLELCPCSGESYRHLQVEVVEQ